VDARELSWFPDASVHLVVTSPPYWTVKEYPSHRSQLGLVSDYEKFHDELDKVRRHALRVLVPGGSLVCVVGDVCLLRKRHGRHMVMPLHADIVVRCRLGFDNLTPILWYKISNAAYEVENGSSFSGRLQPNCFSISELTLWSAQWLGGLRKAVPRRNRLGWRRGANRGGLQITC
jgi:DNA modification methylase